MDTDFYKFFLGGIKLFWVFKVQILTGLFISLSIFSYFYRKYLNYKRINSKQFENIDINDIREHEQLKAQMTGLELKMESGFEVITINLKNLTEKTDDILIQAKLTNGRITALEKHFLLKTFNFIQKNKILLNITRLTLLLIIFRVFEFIYSNISVSELIKKLTSLFF